MSNVFDMLCKVKLTSLFSPCVVGKRRCTSSSRSDSYNSSFEAPRSVRPLASKNLLLYIIVFMVFSGCCYLRGVQFAGLVTGDDPMLSGSDSSRNGSWNFSSDAVKEVLKCMGTGTDNESMNMLDDFAKFINSAEFQGKK